MIKNIFTAAILAAALVGCNKAELIENTAVKYHSQEKDLMIIDENGNINAALAAYSAKEFFANEFGGKKENLHIKDYSEIADEEGKTAFYAFNFDDGWLVLSATVHYYPVAAMSSKGYFTELSVESPDGVKAFFAEQMLEQRRVQNLPPQEQTPYFYAWRGFTSLRRNDKLTVNDDFFGRVVFTENPCSPVIYYTPPTPEAMGLIDVNTRWGRNAPYNALLGHTAHSSVSATAQLLKAYEPPIAAFNWAAMPDVAGGEGTADIQYLYFFVDVRNNPTGRRDPLETEIQSAFRQHYGFPHATFGAYDVTAISAAVAGNGPVYASGSAAAFRDVFSFWFPERDIDEIDAPNRYAFVIDKYKWHWTVVTDECGQTNFKFYASSFYINWGDTDCYGGVQRDYNGWYFAAYSGNTLEGTPVDYYNVTYGKRCLYGLKK